MADEEKEDDKKDGAKAPERKKNLLVPLLLGVNILAVGGIGAYLVFGPKSQAAPAAAPAPAQQEIKVKKGFGQLIEMRPIVANLGGAQSQRYIKLTPYLELANDKIKEDIEKNIVPIRNSFLMYISDLKVEEAVTADQKKKISEDMRKVINEIFGKKVVRRVFFSEFVMQ